MHSSARAFWSALLLTATLTPAWGQDDLVRIAISGTDRGGAFQGTLELRPAWGIGATAAQGQAGVTLRLSGAGGHAMPPLELAGTLNERPIGGGWAYRGRLGDHELRFTLRHDGGCQGDLRGPGEASERRFLGLHGGQARAAAVNERDAEELPGLVQSDLFWARVLRSAISLQARGASGSLALTRGATAKVELVPVAGVKPAQTGLVGHGAHGVVRLAEQPDGLCGLTLRLFVDGASPSEVVALGAPGARLHAPHRLTTREPVSHMSVRTRDGAAVAEPTAPTRLSFRPTPSLLQAQLAARELRQGPASEQVALHAVPEHRVIYRVFCSVPGTNSDVHVANLVTRSVFVSSLHGARELGPQRVIHRPQTPQVLIASAPRLPAASTPAPGAAAPRRATGRPADRRDADDRDEDGPAEDARDERRGADDQDGRGTRRDEESREALARAERRQNLDRRGREAGSAGGWSSGGSGGGWSSGGSGGGWSSDGSAGGRQAGSAGGWSSGGSGSAGNPSGRSGTPALPTREDDALASSSPWPASEDDTSNFDRAPDSAANGLAPPPRTGLAARGLQGAAGSAELPRPETSAAHRELASSAGTEESERERDRESERERREAREARDERLAREAREREDDLETPTEEASQRERGLRCSGLLRRVGEHELELIVEAEEDPRGGTRQDDVKQVYRVRAEQELGELLLAFEGRRVEVEGRARAGEDLRELKVQRLLDPVQRVVEVVIKPEHRWVIDEVTPSTRGGYRFFGPAAALLERAHDRRVQASVWWFAIPPREATLDRDVYVAAVGATVTDDASMGQGPTARQVQAWTPQQVRGTLDPEVVEILMGDRPWMSVAATQVDVGRLLLTEVPHGTGARSDGGIDAALRGVADSDAAVVTDSQAAVELLRRHRADFGRWLEVKGPLIGAEPPTPAAALDDARLAFVRAIAIRDLRLAIPRPSEAEPTTEPAARSR